MARAVRQVAEGARGGGALAYVVAFSGGGAKDVTQRPVLLTCMGHVVLSIGECWWAFTCAWPFVYISNIPEQLWRSHGRY